MSLQRRNIEAMHGYTPGEQPAATSVIKLNTNENPYPPSPRVAAALAGIDVAALRRYPPPLATDFRQAAAALHGVSADHVIPTNGGDELLRLVLTTFVEPTDTVVVAEPSYSLYPVLTAIQGCQLERVPLTGDWQLPADFSARLQGAKLCILVNPHAPSGQLLSVETLGELAGSFEGLLLVDEAYVDFVDPERDHDSLPLVRELANVLLLRTLSKGYSLAGLRFGYGLGTPDLIAPMLYKTRDSYNTDLIAQRLATAAISDQDYARSTWAQVRASRDQLVVDLAELGLSALPSQANFLLCQIPEQHGAARLYLALKERGVLVRYFDSPGLQDKLRISIGSAEENRILLDAIRDSLDPGSQT